MSDANSTESTEIWRDVQGFPGYQVSNLGRFRGCRMIGNLRKIGSHRGFVPHPDDVLDTKWRLLRFWPTRNGYLTVSLWKKNKDVKRYIHRLVLEAFIGPCPLGLVACHKDDDPANNRLDNLRWDTQRANYADSVRNGHMPLGSKRKQAKLTEDDVRRIRQLAEAGRLQHQIAKEFGVCQQLISEIIRGKRWQKL